MVFLGNYAYRNFVGLLGPLGKIALLYLGSGGLLAVGSWLPRKQEKLKNYAQVLFAGGLAAVYFTTYAAYHVPALRIIASPVLDGTLLLLWAGFVVWLATRKQSETLALFAIGLGYYTSIMTNVGLFTLYSNLVLTAAAVFFLIRNRWATLTFASLVATYASYGFWRFYHQGAWHWATPGEGLWTGAYFLICYWLMFTAAVFLSRHEYFKGTNRTAFLSLNNGAFFGLFLLTMLQVRQGGFYKLGWAYGSTLLLLAVLASRLLKQDRTAANAYLTQGLLLLTLGFISRYAGLTLGLVFAVECVALYVLSSLIRSRVMFAGSLIAGFAAAVWTFASLGSHEQTDLYLGCGVTALLLVNNLVKPKTHFPSLEAVERARGAFAIAASAVLLRTTWEFSPEDVRPLILALEGLILTASWYAVRSRQLAFAGQVFVAFAQAICLVHLLEGFATYSNAGPWPWWTIVGVGAITLGLCHWWPRQKQITISSALLSTFQFVYCLALVGIVYCGLKPLFTEAHWLVLTSLLALGITVYGLATRLWLLALVGQLFIFASGYEFLQQIYFASLQHGPTYFQALAPLGALFALSLLFRSIGGQSASLPAESRPSVQKLANIYLWATFAMSVGWVFEYIPDRHRFWFLAVTGLVLFVLSLVSKKRSPLLFSGSFTAVAFVYLWVHFWDESIMYWPNACAVLLLLAQQQAAKKYADRITLPSALHTAAIVLGTSSLWLLLSKWVLIQAGGFYLTVAWGFLAFLLFNAGFILRERLYRWAGLALLGLALGRVIIFDVWKLETIYRIFSFMGLGIVLLILGFIYNRYQEKIREWL
ncbi:MAG TPA: DUF2339 domain-containing protein, partial [Candidatus Saccharimonadales bacterium]|nr:DUF2339 domain-containing protein [Candidatus Saccharimonadales bacterium]